MDPFELTKKLITIPSVTGTEREIGEFLSSHLTSLGYRVERHNVVGDRFNVFAFAGEGRVMFCTHIDTVPPATYEAFRAHGVVRPSLGVGWRG
jgi:acetylornithine deacetylase